MADVTKKAAETIVETVFGNIAESLRQGEKVELRRSGAFRLPPVLRAAAAGRPCRLPSTPSAPYPP